jgi:excisionase family DNA binding protein
MPSTNGTANEVLSILQRLLTLPAPARYLRCTLWSVLELIWKGQLPHTRSGKWFQVDRRDFDELLDREKKCEVARPASRAIMCSASGHVTDSGPSRIYFVRGGS